MKSVTALGGREAQGTILFSAELRPYWRLKCIYVWIGANAGSIGRYSQLLRKAEATFSEWSW